MKNIFKYMVSVFVGAMTLAACQQEVAPLGSEISVDPATLSVAGQNAEAATVKVTADGDWVAVVPEWITANPAYGAAGETTVTLTFADNVEGENNELAAARKATVLFSVNAKSAELVVEQAGDPDKAPAETRVVTCEEFNAATDGEGPFQLVGTITNIEQLSPSTAYNNGNLTITDETGSVYLYRVGPGDGNKLEDLNLAVGDKITVEGKKGSYQGSPQMAQGGVILNVEKSLIAVNKVIPETLPIEGGELMVTLMCKGEGIEVVIPETATWLSVVSKEHSGELAVVVLKAEANEGGNRTQDVEFVTTLNGTEYKAVVTISQTGAIQVATAAEINAAEDGTALYKLTGYITRIAKEEYGNLYIKDATGEVYVYGTLDAEGNTKNFASLGIKAGDIVTVVGPKSSYNESPQMVNVTVEKHVSVQDVTVQAFLDAEKNDNVYYRLTGKLKGMEKAGAYGNIYVEDETAEAYVYGVLAGWGGPKGKFAEFVEATGLAEGDIITVVGTRSAYNDKPQMANAFYVSHTPGQAEEPETPENPTPEVPETPEAGEVLTLTNAEICAAMTSTSTSYTNYTIESASGVWTVNASQNQNNTYLQCRGKNGAYILTPEFDKDIKSVTLYFSEAKSVYANNVYCVFPSTWTVPTTEDAAYPEDGNVGRAVTDESYSLTIPVDAGNKQVYISLIRTNAYYIDHIDVAF